MDTITSKERELRIDQIRYDLGAAERKAQKLHDLVTANEQIGRILMEQRTEAQKQVAIVKDAALNFIRTYGGEMDGMTPGEEERRS